MNCFRCGTCQMQLSVKITTFDNQRTLELCTTCASKFINQLANWKDFEPVEELLFWCNKEVKV